MKRIPRGDFVPVSQRAEAYSDSPLPLSKWGFNVSAPHMYAMCLEALEPQPGMSFLDIGRSLFSPILSLSLFFFSKSSFSSGCGHLTALASELVSPGGTALGLDVRDDIVEFARQNVAACGKQRGITFVCEFENRNCFIPDIDERTFDRIHTGACCPIKFLPKLVTLLNPGGILVTPCGKQTKLLFFFFFFFLSFFFSFFFFFFLFFFYLRKSKNNKQSIHHKQS
jgi:protein-L-isoaspartate O-methyltransferase